MMKLFSRFKRATRNPVKGLETIKALFSKFRMILDLNTRFLEKLAEMETSLGGEFVFDSAYLNSSLQEVNGLVYQVVYSLNALTDNRYIDLFDKFQTIKAILENIVEGGLGPYGNKLTVPHSVIRWEMEPLVGHDNACLGEIHHSLGRRIPDGFVITVTAYRHFMEANQLVDETVQFLGKKGAPESDHTRFTERLKKTGLSRDLEQAIQDELTDLYTRRGPDVSLSMHASVITRADSPFSKPTVRRILEAPADLLTRSYPDILLGCLLDVVESNHEPDSEEPLAIVVSIREVIPSRLHGTIVTFDPENSAAGTLTITAGSGRSDDPAADPDDGERYVVAISHPHDLMESRIIPKPLKTALPDGTKPLDQLKNTLLRGSALVGRDKLTTLVEIGVEMERIFGLPQKINWAEDDDGQLVITAIEPIIAKPPPGVSTEALSSEIQQAILLLDSGATAQVGTATGLVVHVTDQYQASDFPLGGIAIARHASPQLSPVLRRAGALITEVGAPAGHLATVAREFRVPMIVGSHNALELLQEGSEVTVDAEECKVYEGSIPALLNYNPFQLGLLATDPEYNILRRMLRWMTPLNLIDPESTQFKPDGCQSLHDIIHFSHEKAVDEIVNLHRRHKHLKNYPTRTLESEIPLNITILDMADGLSLADDRHVRMENIASKPFQAILKGLLVKDTWDQEPSRISMKDIISGMKQTQDMLASRPEFVGQNLAIISRDYLNFSLRLGYHFNVVDSYVSDHPNENYIYFRFVGGFADPQRRHNRAGLIQMILESLDFNVKIKGDLVVGKLKMAARQDLELALIRIGELIAFTRQLDVKLVSEADVERTFKLFMEKARNPLGQSPE
ncbi:hypothetical protein KKI24_25050 [bacterium]|nr:hypothetical protein [bacterium]